MSDYAIKQLQISLGYLFQNPALLQQALAHRSSTQQHNERLEFLGDAVLGLAITEYLYSHFPNTPEGDLSHTRSYLVRQDSLVLIAERLQLAQLISLGEGELKSGGFRRPSILADTVEALFGAVFIEAGFAQAKDTVLSVYQPMLAHLKPGKLEKDAKTRLQEWLQSRSKSLPDYSLLTKAGAAHKQQFEVLAKLSDFNFSASAQAGSRRAAEQLAAQKLIDQLSAEGLWDKPEGKVAQVKIVSQTKPQAPRKQLKLNVATTQREPT